MGENEIDVFLDGARIHLAGQGVRDGGFEHGWVRVRAFPVMGTGDGGAVLDEIGGQHVIHDDHLGDRRAAERSIAGALREARQAAEDGTSPVIVIGVSGSGQLDLPAYSEFLAGDMADS